MKKLIVFITVFFGAITISRSQIIDWGVKGGLNYNSNGDLIHEVSDIFGGTISNSNAKTGFHFGVFATTKGKLFVRPELVYTQTKSEYEEGNLTINKIDIPVLAGLKILQIANIFVGPSFQYILNTDLENFKLSDVEKNLTVGLNIGAGVQLGKLGFDIRYERGFTSNEADFLNVNQIGNIDTRPEQLILSVSFKI